ncbi:MAG TPA: Xaa-Pro peptidase family protein [Ilumatobacteraceae bacterium]|nr:Xaa-Pro peptidase family protein [Ilumatobacteraceae bacterium]
MTTTATPSGSSAASRGIRYPHPIDYSLYNWPTFSDAEFARRHQIVRDFMDEHGLEALLITGNSAIWERGWANIRWVSNFMGTMELDCTCVFPRHGDPMLAILGLNARLPDRLARSVISDIRGGLNTAPLIVDYIRELGISSGRIGIIPPAPYIDINHDAAVALNEAFPNIEFPRFSDEFWRKRMVLSEEELACIDEAGRIGDAAVQAIIDRLRPGMREQDLFNIIYDSFSVEGGENPCMVLAASENMFHPTSAFQRPRPIGREIQQGDVLLLELGARDGHGYEAQTGKPIIYGPPPKDYAAMLDTCLEAYHAIADVLKPGCSAADIRKAGSVITERGYTVVAPLVHGVFNPIDAGPFVGTSHRPDKDVILEPGMGVCVEIHPCSEDIIRGVFLGDTFVITEDGARCVNKLEAKVYQL